MLLYCWRSLWTHVIPHFEQFLVELELTDDQRTDAFGKATRLADSLASNYYPNQSFDPNVAMVSGSLGKHTAIRPPSDVDLIFILPRADFYRIRRLTGNKQSQLLQEVKKNSPNYLPEHRYPRRRAGRQGAIQQLLFRSSASLHLRRWQSSHGAHEGRRELALFQPPC